MPPGQDTHSSRLRVHRPHRRLLWSLAALVAAVGIVVGINWAFVSDQGQYSWPPEPCVVGGIDARCGTFVVPENRTKPNGRGVAINVLVLPSSSKPVRKDAVAFLAGGPGDAASEQALAQGWDSSALRTNRDFVLVDQRGTGGSQAPDNADVTQYGTRMAMDDLDAVRTALGYRQLDLIGSSYGATAAQVYLRLHPSSVRTLILSGGSAIDVPFFGRFAVNAQRALDQLATLCASDPACRKAFPSWERQFSRLVKAWNAHPGPMTGDQLASTVQFMLLDLTQAVSIPLVVSRAAAGDDAPLRQVGSREFSADLDLMRSSIWCNEPWTGLAATGVWGTDFDSYTSNRIAAFRQACSSIPKRAEPRSLWTLPRSSSVPLLALAGGADPQDPVTNLSDLKRHFPDSRIVVFPHIGHQFNVGGCVDSIITDFVDRGTSKGLDTSLCDGAVVVPPFELTD